MDLPNGKDRSRMASTLVHQLIENHDPIHGSGNMTCSIYDTAWVAMIAKTVNGQTDYLFPSCFEHLLRSQQNDGGWDGSRFSSEVDSVLNGLAALLAICRHISRPYRMREAPGELEHRKNRAVYFLETKFSQFNISSTSTHSDFQPLITKLLQMLEQECVSFSFPGRELFFETKTRQRIDYTLATLYGNVRTVATQSLEGRVGEINFNRLSQHKIHGSMMASPASTAVYLMNCSIWDDEAEAYLQHIVSVSNRTSFGGVPAKFPTTVFELTGVISILLENGFSAKELGNTNMKTAADFLQDCLRIESGVTGLAPYVVPDADNTARAVSTLALLGSTTSPQEMIHRFESREYFKTYTLDNNASFGTNCLALKALLDLVPENSEHLPQIEKLVAFLCNYWWTTNGHLEDESNLSPNYPVMLMVEVFVRLIQLWAQGCVPVPNDPALQDKVITCLLQALIRTLQAQKSDGSWGSSGCETVAYAIITLTRLLSLTSAPKVKLQVTNAIENGRKYLMEHLGSSPGPDHVWSGKTTSGSSVLYKAYVLAALQAPVSERLGATIESHFEISLAKITIQTKYYAKQASFTNVSEWLIQACLVESYLFLPQIRDIRYAAFPYDSLDDSHVDIIPFAWVAASNINHQAVGAEYLYQMMIIALLGQQLEDYMQNMVADIFSSRLFEVNDIICSIFQELEVSSKDHGFNNDRGSERSPTATASTDVRSVLYRFISHVLNHPYVLTACERDQAQLKSELLAFLLSCVSQLSGQHATSATDQTAHSYTFAFLGCLVGNQNSRGGFGLRCNFLESPEQQYLAADMCRHISIISFMSSNARDEHQHVQTTAMKSRSASFRGGVPPLRRSVSSASTSSSSYPCESLSPVSPISSVSSVSSESPRNAFFPKCLDQLPLHSSLISTTEHSQLNRLFDHERRCLILCLDSIGKSGINQRTANILKAFVDSSELSEQIYNDTNIGSCYESMTESEVIEQACILDFPVMAPKKGSGSVAAARAALTVPPLVPRQTPPRDSSPVLNQQPLQPYAQNIEHRSSRHASPQSDPQPSRQSPQTINAKPAQQPRKPTHNPELLPGFQHEPDQVSRQHSPSVSAQPCRDMLQKTSQQIFLDVSQQLSQEIFHRTQKQTSRSQSFVRSSEPTPSPSQERSVATPVPVEVDWSWNRKPSFPVRRSSRASSEISRIERIMNHIDGVKLQPKFNPEIQRRTTSESDTSWIPPQPRTEAHGRSATDDGSDAEAIKLAKVRLQTQKRAESEAHRKLMDARRQISEAQNPKKFVDRLQSKSMVDVSTHEVKRRATYPDEGGWVKSPPAAVDMPSIGFQKGRLHRARRLGGPKWKAPF